MSNLRIKNKRLKRELESLKSMNAKSKVIHDRRDIVRLRSSRRYDCDLYIDIPEDVIIRQAVNDLTNKLKDYIWLRTYRDYDNDCLVVEANLDVVQR